MKYTIIIGILAIMLIVPMVHADITTGLQGYWKFDNNLRDETTNYNDGIAVNGISYLDGYMGKGVHTDSAYSAINVGNSSSLQITGDITISMWIYPEDDSCGTFLISKAPSDNGEYTLFFSTAVCDSYTALFRNSYSSGYGVFPTSNEWTMVTFRANSTDSSLLFNETLMYEGAGIVADTNSSAPVYIGNTPAETAYGHNVIYDEVRIYDRMLSYDDIQEIYEYNGTTPTTTTTTVPSNTSLLPLSNLTISVITGNIIEPTSSYCVDNSTLRKVQDTTIQTEGGDYSTSKYTEFTCDFGCVQTSPSSAECTPKPLDLTLMFIGAVVVVFVIILIAIGIAKR